MPVPHVPVTQKAESAVITAPPSSDQVKVPDDDGGGGVTGVPEEFDTGAGFSSLAQEKIVSVANNRIGTNF